MASLSIKKGDTVYVLSGKSRQARLTPDERERTPVTELKAAAEKHPGRRGKVLRVFPADNKVVVEGANQVTKHNRRARAGRAATQQQTGRVQQPAPMPASKVMLVCPKCDRPTRPRSEERDGKRIRVCRKCDGNID